jgi:hypothetical protein
VTSATPAKPIPKLSANITAPNTRMSGPVYASVAKLAIVTLWMIRPRSSSRYPNRIALKPPAAMPSSDDTRPIDALTVDRILRQTES